MSLSLGEATDLAIKACRGSGAPWGIAEEAGFAVRWLESHGVPALEQLAHALEADSLTETIQLGGELATLSPNELPEETPDLDAPALVLPFLSVAMPAGAAIRAEVGSAEALVSSTSIAITGRLPYRASIRLEMRGSEKVQGCRRTRVAACCDGALTVLRRLASRTYAPNSEHSRSQGAGAGTLDSD